MPNTTHTAGTWTAEHHFAGGIAIVSSHRRIHVAHVNKHADMAEEDTANANLIAAAPALLTAVKLACQHVSAAAISYSEGDHGERIHTRDVMIAAIAAAEGRR